MFFQQEAGVIGADGDAHGSDCTIRSDVASALSFGFSRRIERPSCSRQLKLTAEAVHDPNRRHLRARRRAAAERPSVDLSQPTSPTCAPEPGDVVAVRGPRGRTLGLALYSNRSQIALRMLMRGDEDPARRGAAAAADRGGDRVPRVAGHRRDRLPPGSRRSRSAAVADRRSLRRLPGRAGAVAGDGSAAAGGRRRALTSCCSRAASSRATIRARGCSKGWSSASRCSPARCRSRSTVTEAGIEYDVDLRHGQKTGLFLDQRENRAAAALYARGRLLDCFSYHGGFALALARRVRRDDRHSTSPRTPSRASAQNAARNGVAVDARVGNVFDELRGLERLGERFDTIVLDPPAFAKNKAAVAKAAAGYKEINLRALKLLNPGGTLVTCSCSYHVNEAAFAEIVYDAAVDAQVHVTVVEKRMQGRDHPVLLGVPETYYLKCFILRKLA